MTILPGPQAGTLAPPASTRPARATTPGRRRAASLLGAAALLLAAAAPAPAPDKTADPTPGTPPAPTARAVPGSGPAPAVDTTTTKVPADTKLPDAGTAPDKPVPRMAAPRSFTFSAEQAQALLTVLDGARAEGLNPAAFGRAKLASALSGDAAARSAAASEAAMALARAYATGALPADARADWFITAGTSDDQLAVGLAGALAGNNLAGWYAALLPQTDMYNKLRDALAHYHDAPTRNLVMINMERWRWIPRNLGERHIFANVPALAVEYVDGQQTRHFDAIVGKSKTATPAITANAVSVTINPYWTVPQSLYGKKLAYITSHKATAARLGYRTIKIGDKTYVQQRPGPKNALGRLKIEMPNRWDIYLHDTDQRQLFDKEARLFSHGCVRVQHVQDLAALLLGGDWTADKIEDIIATGKNTREPLPHKVPVYIAYLTTALNDAGEVVKLPDRYERDAALIAAFRPYAVGAHASTDEVAAR